MSRPEQLIEVHHMRKLRVLIAENEVFLFELRAHQQRLQKALWKDKSDSEQMPAWDSSGKFSA